MEGVWIKVEELEKLKQQRDDLIEQQAERIKELEAALESRTSTNAGWNAYYALCQRIKELEAEIGIGHLQCIADRQKYKQELAALRQRIADAPVVAWGHFWKIDGEEILQWPVASSAEEAAKDIQMYAEGDREQMSVKPLINKEDLQQ